MKKGCDLQTPEGSKNKMGVWHIYHTKLYPSTNFSWKESSIYYCSIWKLDIQKQRSERQMLLYPEVHYYHRYKYFKWFLLKAVVLFLYSVSKLFLNQRHKIFLITYT